MDKQGFAANTHTVLSQQRFYRVADLSKQSHQILVPRRVVLTRSQFGTGVRSQLKEI